MALLPTIMEKEVCETPQIVATQLRENNDVLSRLADRLTKTMPPFAITIGRGSSDNACTFCKYLLETKLGIITASSAPSIVTVYDSELRLKNALVLGISQAGRSPDICKMMKVASISGAVTVAIVNDINSPLAEIAEFVIPMHAGEEQAVAATKSFLSSLVALVHFLAVFSADKALLGKLKELPSILQYLLDKNHTEIVEALCSIDNTFVIGRGYGFPIAQEISLKLKETAGIQAEAFSSAEILHGPFALIKSNHPYILLLQDDPTLCGTLELAHRIKLLGGKIIFAMPKIPRIENEVKGLSPLVLPLTLSLDPLLDPILLLQAFYPLIARLAVMRGYNPDAPVNLKKVTETL